MDSSQLPEVPRYSGSLRRLPRWVLPTAIGGALLSALVPQDITHQLQTLTDLKAASRFGGTTAELQELLDKAESYEAKFLAGEDLDVNVHITRSDGSVFESDGVYRLVK